MYHVHGKSFLAWAVLQAVVLLDFFWNKIKFAVEKAKRAPLHFLYVPTT